MIHKIELNKKELTYCLSIYYDYIQTYNKLLPIFKFNKENYCRGKNIQKRFDSKLDLRILNTLKQLAKDRNYKLIKDSYIKTFRMDCVKLVCGQFLLGDILFSFDLKEDNKENVCYYNIKFQIVNNIIIANINEDEPLKVSRLWNNKEL